MAQFLAIDWSRHEARFVLANGNGTALDIEAAGAVPLANSDIDHESLPVAVGTALKSALTPHKTGKAKVLVGVDRAGIEIHHLLLPPASEEELPILVSNQVVRESPTVTDESVVDFVTETSDPQQPRKVTAAVLSPEQLNTIQSICHEAGVTPHRVLVRPYASASLFLQSRDSHSGNCLLINLVDDEVDLTIVSDERVTFSRTVRIPRAAIGNGNYEKLFAEIPRTLMVASQGGDQDDPVTSICLFGNSNEHQPLLELIREKLNLKTEMLDPFEAIGSSSSLVGDNSGRFSSLLGMIAIEARNELHAIDFLNPRKPPVKQSYRRQIIMAASLAAAALFTYGYFVWEEFSEAEDRITALREDVKKLDENIDQAEKKKRLADTIANWQKGNVSWLDELRDLSLRLPGSRDMTILRMSMSPSARSGGGIASMQVRASGPAVENHLAKSIRDEYHHNVDISHGQGRPQSDGYAWHFDTSISVLRRGKEDYVSHLSGEERAARETATNEADESPKSKNDE